ncbi:MAG: succinate dehydrogenase, hydrophobic membrane anchor protein [Pseudomonadota bacterium]
MSFRTPRARAAYLGSAHEGAHHWWTIRISSIALVPLTLLFVVPFAGALGEGREAVLALYAQPFHALVAVLMIAVTFHHLWQGLQVVIQDYVHDKGWLAGLQIGIALLCGAGGLAGVFAVLKIAFTG